MLKDTELPSNISILVVDDEESIREVLEEFLTLKKFNVKTAANGMEALDILDTEIFDVIMLDIKMPVMDGIQVLKQIREKGIESVVIMMTAFGTVETATEAFKLEAYEYILKPFNSEMIFNTIMNAVDKKNLKMENVYLKATVSLFDVAQAVEENIKTDKFINRLGKALLEESSADVISVYLLNKMQNRYSLYDNFFAGGGFDIGLLDEDRIIELLKESEDILSSTPAHKIFFYKPPEKKLHSFMVVPLKRGQNLMGFLVFYSFNQKIIFKPGQKKFMKVFASYFSTALENSRLYQDLMENFNQTVQSFAHAIEAKDKYTQGHSERVTMYSVSIAQEMNMPESEIDVIYRAGRLHDIGKIGLQYEKLNKPGKLTDEEFEMFKKHPTIGKKILEPIKFLQPVIPLVYHHHEKFDGKGYPGGLKGDAIPLGARILSVADTYDAMTSDRSYRKALSHAMAMEEINKYSGTQFDPEIVQFFNVSIDKYRNKCREMGLDCPD